MTTQKIVFGLLDNSDTIEDQTIASKYRDFTLWWSRYEYRGPVIERRSVREILDEARARGHRYCLIQAYGNLIRERWSPESQGLLGFLPALTRWIEANEFVAAGKPLDDDGAWFGLDTRCLLVDVERYAALPENVRDSHVAPADVAVVPLPDELLGRTLDLEPRVRERTGALARFFGDGIEQYCQDRDLGLGDDQRAFLEVIDLQTSNARRNVFLWNIEGYEDLDDIPQDFSAPVTSLYAVAAGFKPYRILATHGFDANTRVVFFDYSPNALRIKERTVSEWDGEDFPAFARHLFEEFPHPDTFYQLWGDVTPDKLDWKEMESAWERELQRWGGAAAFREHWASCRTLEHEYVLCDVLANPWKLVQRIRTEQGCVIWWSNAFFTMIGNWFSTVEKRRSQYEQFAERLAATCPSLLLYGADYNNVSVNAISAGEYWVRYRNGERDVLEPTALHRRDLRT